MTTAQAVAHLESRVGIREQAGFRSEDCEDWCNAALHRLADSNKDSPSSSDFQADVSISLVSGVGTIPSNALPDTIVRVTEPTVLDPDGNLLPFQPCASRLEFSYSYCQEFGKYAVESSNVYTMPPTGGANPVAGPLTARVIIIPTLAGLNSKYDDELVDELEKIYHERVKLEPPTAEDVA